MSKRTRRSRRRTKRRIADKIAWLMQWQNLRWILSGLLLFGSCFSAYVFYLDYQVRHQFEGKRWAIPARVYARPLEIYPDMALNAEQFENELSVLAYHHTDTPKLPGSFSRNGNHFVVITRDFTFWDGSEPSLPIRLDFENERLVGLRHAYQGTDLPLVRLDPGIIGRIYPSHTEDRVLVKLEEVPPLLVKALVVVEDRDFYEHNGIALRSIARAMWANIRAGGMVQGGSTLTQQLVKNFFLSNERTLWRKFNEAIMSLLLEWHYEKNEILEAYINEIYLGQDGKRSIHGFGLASQFYFEKPLKKLTTEQIALLVAMVKGPSFYDPRRYEKRARERRDLVLELLEQQRILTELDKVKAMDQPLGVTARAKSSISTYPAFIDLVRRQLRTDYKEEDLTSEGLQIFTTLDPVVQYETEKALTRRVEQLGKRVDTKDSELQASAVVVSVEAGEVLSVVGDRNPRFSGFNRAIDAVRQIGSLIKPAVYLTALQHPEKYSLISRIDDGPLSLKLDTGDLWAPENYDHEFHGEVPLITALSNSYNLSAARVGLDVGVPRVIDTLQRLGVTREMKPYPSLLLGAVQLSPMEVAQMYHTLASGGFRTPLRAIREVLTSKGEPLTRYPLSVEKEFDAAQIYLLNTALKTVMRTGTGRYAYTSLPESLVISGKTGTSDDLRDSWFAGYTGDKLGVVWLGKDNNEPTQLTGSSGALRVWTDIFRNIRPQSAVDTVPEAIEMAKVDRDTYLLADSHCSDTIELPFIKGQIPALPAPCAEGYTAPSAGEAGDSSEHKPERGFFERLFGN